MQDHKIKLQLSQAYKILSMLGFDDHTYTHLSARSFEQRDEFYINPIEMTFEEIESDVLIKMHITHIVNTENTKQITLNQTGYYLHNAIYSSREDINVIFHLHTPETVAVSALKGNGFMTQLSQWALHFHDKVSYHEYDSLVLTYNKAKHIAENLGNSNKVMFLRNHGIVTCGNTIQEAMFYTYHLIQACKVQCLSLAMGVPISLPSFEICNQSTKDLTSFEKDLGIRDWNAWVRKLNAHYNK